jgi:uncharacterized lipoprotein YbaY
MMSRFIIVLVLAGALVACGRPEQAPSTMIQTPVRSPSAAPASPSPQAPQPAATVAATTVPASAAYPPPAPATSTPQPSSTLRGTISYLAELTLPPDAAITIQLLEVRPKDMPSAIVNQSISSTGSGPIPFTIEYDPTRIDPQWGYVVSAEVHDLQGQLLFVTPWYPVLTQGHPATAEVVLQAPLVLRGTVSYPAQPALPPGAVLTVQLVNQSFCGFFGCLIVGEQRITPKQSPTPFALAYNSALIDPQWSYVVVTQIGEENTAELNWWVEQPAPVLTQGDPAPVDINVGPRPAMDSVTGIVSYPAQPALPPGAVLTVQLLGLTESGVGGPAIVSEQTIALDGQGSTPFTIAYDPAKIGPLWSYAVDARISAPGRLDWKSEQLPPVLTQGHPASAEVKLKPPPAVAAVSGTVTFPAQPALPADAVLAIHLVSTLGWSDTLGAVRINPVGPGPISFTLEYDPASIDPQGEYVVYAMLRAGERLIFVTTTPYPVITQGHPTTMDAVLQTPVTEAAISGTITYHAQSPLPPEARLVIEVQGWFGDDVQQPVGKQVISPVGAGPIPFAIQIDPATIEWQPVYSLRASVLIDPCNGQGDCGGQILFSGGQDVLAYVPIDVTLEPLQ